MEIRQAVSANVLCGEASCDRRREPALVLIELRVGKTCVRGRANPALGKLEVIALADTPGSENRSRNDHTQRVADASNHKLHGPRYTAL